MPFPDSFLQELKLRSDITEIASSYVNLKRHGRNMVGLCPFHGEKTPSFNIYTESGSFYCFGCGAGGDVITFIMKIENLDYVEAVKFLAQRAGMEMPENTYDDSLSKLRMRIYEANREAARFFHATLLSQRGQSGLNYLRGRALSDRTIRHFGLGFADDDWNSLCNHLKSKGFSEYEIYSANLAFKRKNGNGIYDRFVNRVMFPIIDLRGNVIAFGGRIMTDEKPKYLNTSDTPVFKKSENLFSLNNAKSSGTRTLILCEGYMDVIAMHQAGFTQAVASLGTAFTVEQANLLHRYAENILLAYDSDGAGTKAALRGIGILREAGLTGKVINMRPYKDPDEFIKNLGKEAFQERINQAENSFYFEIRILSEQYDQSDPEQRTKFHREIAQKLCEFSEDLERENYLQAIAEKYMIRPDDLRKMVIGYASQTGIARPIPRPRSGVQNKSDPSESGRKSQRLLITWIGDDPSLYTIVRKYISLEDFTEELYRKVAEKMFAELDNGQFQPAGIISMFEDEEEQRQAAELFHTTLPELSTKQERERAFHDILVSVKRNSYQYYMAQLGTDVNAVKKAVEGKKALEELQRARISLE